MDRQTSGNYFAARPSGRRQGRAGLKPGTASATRRSHAITGNPCRRIGRLRHPKPLTLDPKPQAHRHDALAGFGVEGGAFQQL